MASLDDVLFLIFVKTLREACMINRSSKFISIVLAFALICTSVIFTSAAESDVSTFFEANGLVADFEVETQWDGSHNGIITVTNTGTEPVDNWAFTFDFSQEITNIWNAAIIEHQPGVYTVKNLVWNQDIPVGGSINFGFTAADHGEITPPSFIVKNARIEDIPLENVQIEYVPYSDWGSGFTSALQITNLSETAIEDWLIDFDFMRNIDRVSSAKLIEHKETHYVIQNDGFTQNISPNQSFLIGMGGSDGSSSDVPGNIVLKQVNLAFDLVSDTDGDQILDWIEICIDGTDPLVVEGETPTPTAIPTPVPIVSPTVFPTTEPSSTPTVTPVVSPTPDITEDHDADGLPDIYEKVILRRMILDGISVTGIESVHPSDDYDEDGMILTLEYEYDTNPFMPDSDEDGLNDYDEVFLYGTSPISNDSDGDAMGDGTEIDAGLDPLSSDSDGDTIPDSEEIVTQHVRLDSIEKVDSSKSFVEPSVVITGKGDYSEKMYATMIEDHGGLFTSSAIVGRPFEFVHDEDLSFESSILSFRVNDSVLEDNNIVDLKIAFFDEETSNIEILETTYNTSTKTLSASVDHYSTYMLVNAKRFRYMSQVPSGTPQPIAATRHAYNGHLYALVDESMTWTDARDFCAEHGGHLVIIEDEFEQQFLTNLIHSNGRKNLYWIGLSGEDEQCSWVDGTPVSYTNWGAGEPNSTTETVVHMYCQPVNEFNCGDWNDTLNENFVSSTYFWSTYNCGIIIEWDNPDELGAYKITLSDGTVVELDQDPSLGDITVDSDGDGIPDVIELDKLQKDTCSGLIYWTFYSNPGKTDTDGDTLPDIDDLNPRSYDAVVTEHTDSYIKFNSGRTWNIITCTAYDFLDNLCGVIDGHVDNPMSIDEFRAISANWRSNDEQEYSLDELTVIGLVNNDGTQLYMDKVSSDYRETVFQRLAQRESRYYQHRGILCWADWYEVAKGTKGGFFRGKVFSEADINFSTRLFYSYDVYDVLSSLIILGALVIASIVATKCAPIVAYHIDTLLQYIHEYGVKDGLNMYLVRGPQGMPDGVFSWVQMDMEDGDCDLDDVVNTTVPIHERGASGQAYIEETYGGIPQYYFRTEVDGVAGGRFVDLYNNGVAYESKVGYTCLNQRVRIQIIKDGWLLQTKAVEKVVWVFTESSISGTVGATQSVFDLLKQYGIQYVVHVE